MALPSSKYIGAGTPNIAVPGGALVAPLATALPTGAAGINDPAFKALGYVFEDGIIADTLGGFGNAAVDAASWAGAALGSALAPMFGPGGCSRPVLDLRHRRRFATMRV
ncbi:hypothetical protein [Nocardia africana]|uniref:Uncharacterized protein n=1 Tax=Nocardia africana TaxID=134964 RepID=A0A378X4D1_9NOCA|nr:hypothetical protein [Nocardia africana]MCC3316784.1 hypothetical protein [Nocardia africana]SUA47501.1 Uncharacterised protein [Nocardia africana]